MIENVYVLPGLPAEMKAMFQTIEHEFTGSPPIESWRRTYRARESEIVEVLVEAGERWPGLRVGSYPSFDTDGPEVEIVLKSQDEAMLSEAAAWVESALARAPAVT